MWASFTDIRIDYDYASCNHNVPDHASLQDSTFENGILCPIKGRRDSKIVEVETASNDKQEEHK